MANGDLLDTGKKRVGAYSESYKLLDNSGATDLGVWVDVRTLVNMSVHVFGTFVGTVQILVSNENQSPGASDGNGIQVGANITAPGVVNVGMPCRWIKAKWTRTSGNVNAYLHGNVGG